MVKFIIILLVFFLLPRKASADIGSLFGGSDAPEYRQISPESTMTESQKAMQQYLTALGKLGYEKGTKAFDPERAKRSNAFYNATLSAIQGGVMGMNPRDINAAVAQTMASQPVETTKTEEKKNPFVPDAVLEDAVYYYDQLKRQPWQGQPLQIASRSGQTFDPQGALMTGIANGTITKEMAEAYRRQKQAADDAALLAKAVK